MLIFAGESIKHHQGDMSALQAPLKGKEYIIIAGTNQGPVRRKVLFTLKHLSTEYWGCEWTDSPLIINAQAVILEDGEYVIHYSKSMETANETTLVLSNALFDAFMDNQIVCERLFLAELDKNELVWENEQLASAYQEVVSSF